MLPVADVGLHVGAGASGGMIGGDAGGWGLGGGSNGARPGSESENSHFTEHAPIFPGLVNMQLHVVDHFGRRLTRAAMAP